MSLFDELSRIEATASESGEFLAVRTGITENLGRRMQHYMHAAWALKRGEAMGECPALVFHVFFSPLRYSQVSTAEGLGLLPAGARHRYHNCLNVQRVSNATMGISASASVYALSIRRVDLPQFLRFNVSIDGQRWTGNGIPKVRTMREEVIDGTEYSTQIPFKDLVELGKEV